MFMVTGGKLGAMFGRKRVFIIGCLVYGLGSLTTALAPNLPILILGWSFFEGVGAAMILPAVVALVAGNVPAAGRPRAFGLVMGAGRSRSQLGRSSAVSRRPISRGAGCSRAKSSSWYSFCFWPVGWRNHLALIGLHWTSSARHLLPSDLVWRCAWGWVKPKPDAPSLGGVSLSVCGSSSWAA
jgi:MFS family permease